MREACAVCKWFQASWRARIGRRHARLDIKKFILFKVKRHMDSVLTTVLIFGGSALVGLVGAWATDVRVEKRTYPLTKTLGDFAAIFTTSFIVAIVWAWLGNENLSMILLISGSKAQNGAMLVLYAFSFKFLFLHLLNWHRHRSSSVTASE